MIKLALRGALRRYYDWRATASSTPFEGTPLPRSAVIFSPHADDETFGCGGLIAHLSKARATIEVVFMTDSGGSHPNHPILAPSDITKIRAKEAETALEILSSGAARISHLDLPDGTLDQLSNLDLEAAQARVRETVRRTAPDLVLVPSRHDGSTEHEAANLIVRTALQSISGGPRILEYLVWARWSPRLLAKAVASGPIIRLDMAEHRSMKRKAIQTYRSQLEATPPWTRPVLPPGFGSAFDGRYEYYLAP